MFTPFAYDPFFSFPPTHSTSRSNQGRNRRLRGFIPIWDEFDRMTDEFLNDPFLNDSMNIDNTQPEQLQLQSQDQKQEEKSNQKLIKGGSNKNKNKGMMTTRGKDNTNTSNNNTGLSLWSPAWNSLTLNDKINFEVDEKEDKYIVSAKLNGFNKEHLKLEVKDGLLTVSGEMKEEKKDENSYSKSTRYVARSIALPNNINEEKINAKYENGVLAVNIPKLDKPKEEKKSTIMIE